MWTGSLDKSGSPTLKISIHGFSPDHAQEFDAVIDTGFTGFIAMPLVRAFPLGLILFGTTTVVLADGSTKYKLTALGTAVKEGQDQAGVIILDESSNDILIGMDFLRKFQKVLMLHPHAPFVLLEDCATVDDFLRHMAEAAAKRAAEEAVAAAQPNLPEIEPTHQDEINDPEAKS
jgi:predicted aspartyl protease